MATKTLYNSIVLELRQTTDFSIETRDEGVKETVELPGFIEVGFTAGGVWVPIFRRKASGFLADVARAQKAAAEAVPPPPPPPAA